MTENENNATMDSLLNEMKPVREGDIVEGVVVQVNQDEALVDVGYKHELTVPKRELASPEPKQASDVVKVDDKITVYVQSLNDERGARGSKLKADRVETLKRLDDPENQGKPVEAKVTQVVKGGLGVTVNGIRGFIPGSHADLHFVQDLGQFVGQTLTAIPIEVDVLRQKLVLSRRKYLEEKTAKEQDEAISKLTEGQRIKGKVQRIADFGAFVDVGGIDGLVHVTNITWRRINHPSEVLSVGDEVEVLVKAVNRKTRKISLSIKDLNPDDRNNVDAVKNYREGDLVEVKVVRLAGFGAFAELEPGLDGLIPISELSDSYIEKPEDVISVGDVVTVKVHRVDKERGRVSLSLKRTKPRNNY